MGRRKKRRGAPEDEHRYLTIRVESYEAQVQAAINHDALYPQNAFNLDDRDPLYRFTTDVTVTGTAAAPQDSAGDIYELMIFGDDAPSRAVNVTLADAHARDERYALQYRTYRGQSIPVYAAPPGLGRLHKLRGERRWCAYIGALPRFVNDMLALLGSGRDLYLALHERKQGRERWVQSFSLQTNEPSEE